MLGFRDQPGLDVQLHVDSTQGHCQGAMVFPPSPRSRPGSLVGRHQLVPRHRETRPHVELSDQVLCPHTRASFVLDVRTVADLSPWRFKLPYVLFSLISKLFKAFLILKKFL